MNHNSRTTRGVTLAELAIASAMAAVLLVALAQTAQLFGEQVAYAREMADNELKEVGDRVVQDVRNAWVVTQPNSTSLEIQDAEGAITHYAIDGDSFRVVRPNGASGTLLDDLASCSITVETMPRYREATELQQDDAWWTTAGAGASSAIILQPGQAIGVGFIASSAAPEGVSTVEGVTEQRLTASVDDLVMVIDKINLADHVFWHLYDDPPNGSAEIGNLHATLYESRGPGSAIPYGPAIASVTSNLDHFPTNGYYWIDETTGEVVEPPEGAAYGWWKNHPDVVLVVKIPTSAYSADLSGLAASIEPGRAYVLTLETDGYGAVIVTTRAYGRDTEVTSWSPDLATTPLSELTEVVPFSIMGTCDYTQTDAHDVVSRVTVNFTRNDGLSHTASATVVGHDAALDPWAGAVPGELPVLQDP